MSSSRWIAMGALILGGIGAVTEFDSRPALASCADAFAPGGTPTLRRVLATAPVVFVGTVVATSNGSRTATVRVDDVWRGKHVSRRVIVRGSYVTGQAATSVDRLFTIGVRYLFVPESTRHSSPFQDNNCTATRRYTAALAKYRPHGAHRL